MCYSVPLIASAITTAAWAKNRSPRLGRLNLMLYGASIFGVVDHWWNGELFLLSGNVAKDLLLGVAITLTVFAAWTISLKVGKRVAA